jgi:hypothetical protein
MQCPKCKHTISDASKTCLYCGVPIANDAAPVKTVAFADKNNLFIQTEKTKTEIMHNGRNVKLEDLPQDIRQKVEEALRQGKQEAIIEKTSTVSNSLDAVTSKADIMPLEKITSVLARMKDSLDCGQMKPEVYEPMALSIIRDYLATLDDKAQLTFLDNTLPGIELHKYMTERMFTKLRPLVISSLVDKAKKRP